MRIGELARRTGVNIETIRWYEKVGLIAPPVRTSGNYRDYDAAALARLGFIKRGRDLGFALEQIAELLELARDRGRDCADVDAIARRHLRAIDAKIADLSALRRELSAAIGSCKGGEIAGCNIIDALLPTRAA